ncbi:hypothetical protein OEZ86_012768 [Tetradesmus obliquus]|nr:hypothetical protein OEZ86_012768 [Tetradesmus obliquus]
MSLASRLRKLQQTSTGFPYIPTTWEPIRTSYPLTLGYASGGGSSVCFALTLQAGTTLSGLCVSQQGWGLYSATIIGMGLQVGLGCAGSVVSATLNGSSVTPNVTINTTRATGVLNVSRSVASTAANNVQLCFALGGACPNINSLCTNSAGATPLCGTFVAVNCRSTKSNCGDTCDPVTESRYQYVWATFNVNIPYAPPPPSPP